MSLISVDEQPLIQSYWLSDLSFPSIGNWWINASLQFVNIIFSSARHLASSKIANNLEFPLISVDEQPLIQSYSLSDLSFPSIGKRWINATLQFVNIICSSARHLASSKIANNLKSCHWYLLMNNHWYKATDICLEATK